MTASGVILAVMLTALSQPVKDAAHQGLLKVPCVECHTRLPFSGRASLLRSEVGDVCGSCHERHHGVDKILSHPVNVAPSMRIPPDMILGADGKVVCITCHAFHGEYRDQDGTKRFYLRRTPGKIFCFSCHKKMPGGRL